ncbi:DUF7146 domain-containing protein [Novosphingobium clariflavum]|uniref:Toprim domain-containing protein n=1 Tax=Novosphingobium clariflavum TaxID=2029884 RepID=A0ABV6S1V0_9SPHN|nr:toprim domain-containing protein [Novosphingobium clariflavum]
MSATREFSGPSAGEIADMLRPHAEALGRMIFPNAVMAGGFLCVGSVYGEPGDSLKIQTRGAKRGTWADYATSDSDMNGKGDMLKLLQLTIGGGDMKRGIEEAKKYLNLDSMDPRALERMQLAAKKSRERQELQKASQDERKRRNAEALWHSAAPLTPSSPPVMYLAGRGILFGADSPLKRPPGSIRFHHAVSHKESGRKLPAMATCFVGADNQIKGVHLTFLEFRAGVGWVKIPDMLIEGKLTKVSKKIWGPTYWGAHLPLWKGSQRCPLSGIRGHTPVEAAEGIEDGLSYAMANPDARVIAGGTLGNLGQIILPAQAGDFTILAQNDTNPKPIAALEDAIRKQQRQAREQESRRIIKSRHPLQQYKDWNDWLLGKAR